jgi:hypothetical protein
MTAFAWWHMTSMAVENGGRNSMRLSRQAPGNDRPDIATDVTGGTWPFLAGEMLASSPRRLSQVETVDNPKRA